VNVKLLTWLLIIGMLLLIIICSIFHIPKIEKDLNEKCIKAMNAKNVPFKEIDFDGQDAILHGEVGSEDIRASIEKLVSSVYGVRAVHNNLKVITQVKINYSSLKINEFNGKLLLKGIFPDLNTMQHLLDKLKQKSWARNFETAFEIDTTITDEHSLMVILNWLMHALPKISNPNIQFENGNLVINGNVSTTERLKAIDAEMNKLLKGISYKNNLKIISEEILQIQYSIQEIFAKNKIEFSVNSYELTKKNQVILNEIITLLDSHPSIQLEIEGYTDTSGDSINNLKLSRLRAETVLTYLISGGISPKRLTANGYGDKKPIASNTTVEGRRVNRRVEFIVKGSN
jgi:OOP family OmpA-OmpF porin